MLKLSNKLLYLLLIFALVLTLAGCGDPGKEQQNGGEPTAPVITDTGAGDCQQQLAALTALNALTGATEEARLAELNTSLTTCPFCGKAATWTGFLYDTQDPNKITNTTMSTDENAASHFYVYGDKTTVEGNWLMAATKDTQHYACILLDGNIASEGSILAFFPAVMNVGGRGSISTSTSGQGGLFAFVGNALRHELNLYGGHFYTTSRKSNLEAAVVYTKSPDSIVNIWSDDVIIGVDTKPQDADNPSYNVRCGGTLNMYAGTIQNGKANTGPEEGESGNVHLVAGSTFNMYGGTIKNGYARKGGNLYISPADIDPEFYDPENPPAWNFSLEHPMDNAPVVNIYGGTIEGGHATSNGGGILNRSSALTIDGLVLRNNKSSVTGGNLWTSEMVNISNTRISGGESTQSHGGNIFISDGGVYLDEHTTVENGKAKGRAGNIYANPGATLQVDGAVIQTTDEIHAELGGNIYLAGTLIVNGTISGGHSSGGGGNIYVVVNKATVILGDGEIKDGIDDSNPQGGNINFVTGTLQLTGSGKIDGKVYMPNLKNCKLVVESTFTGDVTVWKDGPTAKVGGTASNAKCTGKFAGTVRNANTGIDGTAWLMKPSGKSLKYAK